jgi:Glu-tRNA(Gln) amidotransferase subunit E-like FAD-binding protein
MDKADRIKLKQLISTIAKKYGLSAEIVENIVNSPYLFTYEKLKDMDFSKVESEEDANKLKTNFNYKGIGKLYFNYRTFEVNKQRKEEYLKINNKRWKK